MLTFLCLLLTLALTTPASAAPRQGEEGVAYQTIDVDFSNAAFTVVTGANATTLIGGYVDMYQQTHGWLLPDGGAFLPLLRVIPTAINAQGLVTGSFRASAATVDAAGNAIIFTWGFLYLDGNFQTLTGPPPPRGQVGATRVEPTAINDAGLVCGTFLSAQDGRERGFLYDTTTRQYTVLEAPGAEHTACLGLSQQGTLLIRATRTGEPRQWLQWERTTRVFAPVLVPDLGDVALVARTDEGLLAGNVGDHGFLFDGAAVREIRVPGSLLTALSGLQVTADGWRVFGRYVGADGVHHGFIATLGTSSTHQGPRRPAGPEGQERRRR